MDFTFSPDQEALRQTVRSFLADEAGGAYVRAMIDDERGFTDVMWSRFADLGWLGLLVPEAHGGVGLGLVDLLVVQEEMGRMAFPGPYLSSAVEATLAATRLDVSELLPGLADGSVRATLALEELGTGDPIDRVGVPAQLLWRFRIDAITGQAVFWAVTGLAFAWLAARAASRSTSTPTSPVSAGTEPGDAAGRERVDGHT